MMKYKIIVIAIVSAIVLLCAVLFVSYAKNSVDEISEQYDSVYDTSVKDSKHNFAKTLNFLSQAGVVNGTYSISAYSEMAGLDTDEEMGEDTASGNSNDTGGSLPEINTGEWYSSMSLQASTSSVGNGAVKLYNGWPWGSADVTFFNWSTAYSDFISDASSIAGAQIDYQENYQVDEDNNCSSSPVSDSGVACLSIAYYPSWVLPNYYESQMTGGDPAWNESDATSKRGCIILKDSSESYWFLPLTSGDNKGHTYPGGVAQTFIKRSTANSWQLANTVTNPESLGLVKVSGTAGSGDGAIWSGADMSTVLKLFAPNSGSQLKYGGSRVIPKISFEMHGSNRSWFSGYLNSYEFIGLAFCDK